MKRMTTETYNGLLPDVKQMALYLEYMGLIQIERVENPPLPVPVVNGR